MDYRWSIDGGSANLLPFSLLVKLVGIYKVVPDAIESTYNGSDRIEEYKSHPDDEDGIFLTESLTSRYCRTLYWVNIFAFVLTFRLRLGWLLPTLSYSPSERELYYAAYGTYGCKSEENAKCYVAFYDSPYRNCDGKGEGYEP